MPKKSTPSFSFGRLGRREITASFDGGDLSTEGGALLLKLAEEKARVVENFYRAAVSDHRNQSQVEHLGLDLLKQRVFGVALGYGDLNDHDSIRHDPLLAIAVGKRDPGEGALASSSTLNRMELDAQDPATDRYKRFHVDQDAAELFFVDYFVESTNQHHGGPGDWIVLDLDPSDIPLHGKQEGAFYHGYYKNYCYLPLYAFSGEHLLTTRLQTADGDAARNAIPVLEKIVPKLRAAWPDVGIMLRADSGFCRDDLFTWAEKHEVDYVIGIGRNPRLERAIEADMAKAKELFDETQEPARLFCDLVYQTKTSWSRQRRVVAKAEHLPKGRNPRFVVTSFETDQVCARQVYEDEYCPRGEAENRIKEKQLDLFGTRASSSTMAGNQIRLYISGLAYLLIQAVRALALKGTEFERAQAGTIRTKLLKIAAAIQITARRAWVRLSSNCPYSALLVRARTNLLAAPTLVM